MAKDKAAPGFWHYRGSRGENIRDEVTVGMYYPTGRCDFEFSVQLYEFRDNRATPHVSVFSDAFEAFGQKPFKELFVWLGEKRPKTLTEIIRWMIEAGFQDKSHQEGCPRCGRSA